MYYNRTLNQNFSALIEPGGSLRWLFDFVKSRGDLDFQIGKNASNEWISVYRGLARIVSIQPAKNASDILVVADSEYQKIATQKSLNMYGIKPVVYNFRKELEVLIDEIDKNQKFDRYYKSKKEGFYQNELSRKYGILSDPGAEFIIIDKEAVIGYANMAEKVKLFGPLQLIYKQFQKVISGVNAKRFGKNLEKKAIGNELDFLALDKHGNILLIEYKHGTYASGIYLSPLQIGLYYDVFSGLSKKYLEASVFEMLAQKKKIGLINPLWRAPAAINEILPVLIISDYNYRSSAKQKFDEVLQIIRPKSGKTFLGNVRTYNYTQSCGLCIW